MSIIELYIGIHWIQNNGIRNNLVISSKMKKKREKNKGTGRSKNRGQRGKGKMINSIILIYQPVAVWLVVKNSINCTYLVVQIIVMNVTTSFLSLT